MKQNATSMSRIKESVPPTDLLDSDIKVRFSRLWLFFQLWMKIDDKLVVFLGGSRPYLDHKDTKNEKIAWLQ